MRANTTRGTLVSLMGSIGFLTNLMSTSGEKTGVFLYQISLPLGLIYASRPSSSLAMSHTFSFGPRLPPCPLLLIPWPHSSVSSTSIGTAHLPLSRHWQTLIPAEIFGLNASLKKSVAFRTLIRIRRLRWVNIKLSRKKGLLGLSPPCVSSLSRRMRISAHFVPSLTSLFLGTMKTVFGRKATNLPLSSVRILSVSSQAWWLRLVVPFVRVIVKAHSVRVSFFPTRLLLFAPLAAIQSHP
jgi:hypothetical protein